MPVAAALPAVISAAGAFGGAAMQAGAAGDAAEAQLEAAEQAAKLQRQQYRDDITYSWPWYSGGVAAQNQLLNLMGLGSAQTASTATGAAGNMVDPATAMVEANKIRQAIMEQIKGDRGLNQSENQLARLQQQLERATSRGNTDQVGTLEDQIAELQAAIDAANSGDQYNLEGIRNPQGLLRRMSDLEVVRMFGPGGQYGPQASSAASGTATPTDTSQAGLQKNALAMFQTDPGYLFRLQEGEKAILRNRAASGGAQSGATLKALERYAQDYASGEYMNYYNRLASLAGRGQVANQNNQQIGQAAANSIGGNILSAGQARATGYINQGNAWAGGLNQLGKIGGYWSGGG